MYVVTFRQRFFITIAICALLFAIAALGQEPRDGKDGLKGAPGSAGTQGLNGEVAYMVLRNDLDLDAKLLVYVHQDYMKMINNREKYSDQQISAFLSVKADEILNYSNGCPTLGSDERDRLFLICFTMSRGYSELINAIKLKGFIAFPSKETCQSLASQQQVAKHGACK